MSGTVEAVFQRGREEFFVYLNGEMGLKPGASFPRLLNWLQELCKLHEERYQRTGYMAQVTREEEFAVRVLELAERIAALKRA